MREKKWTNDDFTEAVKNSYSYAEVLRQLGLKPAGSNYDMVKRKIKELEIDTSHMTGQLWSKGKKLEDSKYHHGNPLKEILVKDSTYTNMSKLKNRILNEGLKERKCECCGLTEWLGQPISLEMHHVNGIKNDLRIENLQILCPNCHAQTDNYRGKNIGKSAQLETIDVEAG